jgi:branched-chain amino acid transport system permease protein
VSAHHLLTRRYEDELSLMRTRAAKAWALVLVLVWVAFPLLVDSPFWLSVLNYAGIAAVGAIGLNLLIGFTGQVSLGHAFFVGTGAYVAAQVGGEMELPFWLWLPAATLFGALVGALVGPFALRLRGHYLAIVTLGLVFFGDYLFRNLDGITGGNSGTSVTAEIALGPVSVTDPELGDLSPNQTWFWFIWALVALAALLGKNVVRTRPGRAMQAIRDRDVAAEVVGVELGRYKVGAFALSSAFAAAAGALYGAYQQFVSPDEWSLFLSIQYIAIIIVGGMGTIFGAVLGALFLGGLPALIEEYSDRLPGVSVAAGDPGLISVFSLNQAIFGLLIVGFLIFEPRGLAAIWLRIKAYFKTWPFSY